MTTTEPAIRNRQTATGNVVLSVRNLHVTFPSEAGLVKAVRGLSFDLRAGETMAMRKNDGRTSMRSMTQSHAFSYQPPMYAADDPMSAAIVVWMIATMKPMISDLPRPRTVRDRTSKPAWVVPKRCWADGGL